MREKLIDIITDYADFLDWERIDGIADAIMEKCFVPDNNVGKWIPVTERLPEDRELVLCFKKGGFGRRVAILTFAQSLEALHEYDFEGQKHSGFVNYDSEVGYYEVSDVTHWMPLPEAPKEDAE